MSSEKDNILQFEQYMKSDKMSYVIYADIMLIKRKMAAQIIHKVLHQKKQTNKQTNKQKAKTGEHIPSGYSMPTIWAFNNIENKHTLYRGE